MGARAAGAADLVSGLLAGGSGRGRPTPFGQTEAAGAEVLLHARERGGAGVGTIAVERCNNHARATCPGFVRAPPSRLPLGARALATGRSLGSPQVPVPVSRIAPEPSLRTGNRRPARYRQLARGGF
jgi:hypothetical protein